MVNKKIVLLFSMNESMETNFINKKMNWWVVDAPKAVKWEEFCDIARCHIKHNTVLTAGLFGRKMLKVLSVTKSTVSIACLVTKW